MTRRWADAADDESRNDIRRQLAIDEAMLSAQTDDDLIRHWGVRGPAVVLGRSSRVADEVDAAAARRYGVDVVRRCTGGASIFADAGCRMYSVALRLDRHPHLSRIDAAHDHVMDRVLAAVRRQHPRARRRGVCDLSLEGKKFSGNALRVTRSSVLYHGTFLSRTDLRRLSDVLDFAPRQPDYRGGRDHGDFVTNAPLDFERLADDLDEQFGVTRTESLEPHEAIIRKLRRERYDDPAWHRRH